MKRDRKQAKGRLRAGEADNMGVSDSGWVGGWDRQQTTLLRGQSEKIPYPSPIQKLTKATNSTYPTQFIIALCCPTLHDTTIHLGTLKRLLLVHPFELVNILKSKVLRIAQTPQ